MKIGYSDEIMAAMMKPRVLYQGPLPEPYKGVFRIVRRCNVDEELAPHIKIEHERTDAMGATYWTELGTNSMADAIDRAALEKAILQLSVKL